MESLQQTVSWLNAVLSDYVLTVLLVGCGVFFSIRTRFVQFRCFGEGIRYALGKFDGVQRRRSAGASDRQHLPCHAGVERDHPDQPHAVCDLFRQFKCRRQRICRSLPVLFRFLVCHRLDHVRQNQQQLSYGKTFGIGLFGRGGNAHFLRHTDEKQSGVGASGSAESADGIAQRGCVDRAFRSGRSVSMPEMTV